jgi:tripartite-type tricarboxylate transporter receptor subunit TctC
LSAFFGFFVRAGTSVVGNSAAEFAAFIRAERERWGKVVRGAGIRAD